MRRPDGSFAEQPLSFFADRAVFYPEDERFLVEADPTVRHYEVEAG